MNKRSQFWWVLPGIIFVGLLLRLWQLDLKPIWLDEVISSLFGLGRNYLDIPQGQVFPLATVRQIFSLNPSTTCPQIVETVSTQSVHPPLFFCWLHSWARSLDFLPLSPLWKLRAFAVFWGCVAIAAVFLLNRSLFSRRAGWFGAAFMAVSPFAVYLSQEARHYTLPMVLITLALLATYHFYVDLQNGQVRWAYWLSWVVINSLGFYVHYFFLLAFAAQVVALALALWWFPVGLESTARPHPPKHLWAQLRQLALLSAAVCLAYLPWLSTFISHITRPETDWMLPTGPKWAQGIAPLYQLPVGWVAMFITLPVEKQPLWLKLVFGGIMLAVFGWVLTLLVKRLRRLRHAPLVQPGIRLLGLYLLVVLAEFFVVIYVLGKDLTLVPRYNFIYFPAVCALVGVGLAVSSESLQPQWKNYRFGLVVLAVATFSSALVVNDFVFQKPYYPNVVAQDVRAIAGTPNLIGVVNRNWQDVALGMSVFLTLEEMERSQPDAQSQIFFIPRLPEGRTWQTLAQLQQPYSAPLRLWLIIPDAPRAFFPESLTLPGRDGASLTCTSSIKQHFRRGVPHRLYQCSSREERSQKRGNWSLD